MPIPLDKVHTLPAFLKKITNNYRVLVFLRFFTATVGGYVFTSSAIALLSFILALSKQDAVYLSVSISLVIYTLVFLYTFAVKSFTTVWISILLSISVFIGVLALLKGEL
ncbi:hypothetical protein J8L70_10125 [Pseudoalteromonas sp. MMG010]|uniref:hypothetical protein n=1 Tax=Pseudoalteromonas sp. MMG010 TaxID=2822685 RepID=UPI001B3A593F|nr:hypothetical protein [Pseudoalteromonas sp. MMG010]MBQ4833596.1 hypothetical protein [Pseudoalteromonas sp. MMG010]